MGSSPGRLPHGTKGVYHRDNGFILGYIGIMEKKMETTGNYGDYIGIIDPKFSTETIVLPPRGATQFPARRAPFAARASILACTCCWDVVQSAAKAADGGMMGGTWIVHAHWSWFRG